MDNQPQQPRPGSTPPPLPLNYADGNSQRVGFLSPRSRRAVGCLGYIFLGVVYFCCGPVVQSALKVVDIDFYKYWAIGWGLFTIVLIGLAAWLNVKGYKGYKSGVIWGLVTSIVLGIVLTAGTVLLILWTCSHPK